VVDAVAPDVVVAVPVVEVVSVPVDVDPVLVDVEASPVVVDEMVLPVVDVEPDVVPPDEVDDDDSVEVPVVSAADNP